MAGLTYDDIADLGRWYSIQFRDEAAAEEALDRYERYRGRVASTTAGRQRPRDVFDHGQELPGDRAA